MSIRQGFLRAFTALTGLLIALCGGALWPIVALVTRSDAAWMAFACALSAVLAVLGLRASPGVRAACAAFYTILGIAYAQYLIASGVIAGTLGVSLRNAVVGLGPEMAFALAYARASRMSLAMMALAVVGAAWVAWRSAGAKSPAGRAD